MFRLSAGAGQLEVTLSCAGGDPGDISNMLCLSLFDPNGFRGSGHRGGSSHSVSIGPTGATPGYLAGPLPAGEWSVVIHARRVTGPCPYEVRVRWAPRAADLTAAPRTASGGARPARPRPGCYRGDLHAHTVASDGSWETPALLAAARAARLDFVTLTDHNTISHLAGIDGMTSDDLLVMGGSELTTFHGHALALGAREWIDWGVIEAGRSMRAIAAEVQGRGGLFVIAHPTSVGDPQCTGCDWRFEDMMPGTAAVVEVWNGPWGGDSNNERALSLWYEWLREGHRLVATAGTDAHGPAIEDDVGFNMVAAEDRTEAAVLAAVARGRVYLTSGPRLDFADGAVQWRDCPHGSLVRLVRESGPALELRADGRGARPVAAGRSRWCVVEVRDSAGALLALSNPVYSGR